MGAVSLEYKLSGAALKCQSRKDYKGHAVPYTLLLWACNESMIYKASVEKENSKDFLLRSSSLWKNVTLENTPPQNICNTGNKCTSNKGTNATVFLYSLKSVLEATFAIPVLNIF